MNDKRIKVYIKENAIIAKVAALYLREYSIAIVFGRTIYLHNKNRAEFLNNERWVLHELKHVQQYQELGFMGFVFQYMMEYFKNGYYKNKFETEARNAERDKVLLERYEII